MTSNYSFPPSMALATREDGSLETRDNAVMRELQVTPSSVPYYLTSILPLVSFSKPPGVSSREGSHLGVREPPGSLLFPT